jgi:beta-lactamase class C
MLPFAGLFVLLLAAIPLSPDVVKEVVGAAVQPVMHQYRVPGMAVAVAMGDAAYVGEFGYASLASHARVTGDTLFEIGSVSKTFTATLAAYASISGTLSLTDPIGRCVPALNGTPFGSTSLRNLGTHVAGGLELQVPDGITNDAQLFTYLRAWQPKYTTGSTRTYSNIGIGMLGMATAACMHVDFAALMEQRLLAPMGLTHTFVNIGDAEMSDYAQGYTKDDVPIRMTPGELWQEAYGIRSSAADMIRFVQIEMGAIRVAPALERAVRATHVGYYRLGAMTQDLIWEQYAAPFDLASILRGNSQDVILDPLPVTAIAPPLAPQDDVWINKTGSTNGFGTYVAFIPREGLGIVILANKNFPIEDRVRIAYGVLTQLEAKERGT